MKEGKGRWKGGKWVPMAVSVLFGGTKLAWSRADEMRYPWRYDFRFRSVSPGWVWSGGASYEGAQYCSFILLAVPSCSQTRAKPTVSN